MTWIIPALGALALLLLVGGEKKEKKASVSPRAGEVWTWVMKTSRRFTDDDWRAFVHMTSEKAALMGATSAGDNRYVVTYRYLKDTPPIPVGVQLDYGKDWVKIESATRAPIA